MQNVKKAGLTRSSNQGQQTCKGGRQARMSSSDLGEDGWCELSQELASKLSPNIVSLASFHDGAMYSQCTGIVIRNKQSGASFLTSSDLLTMNGRFKHSLKIKVRLPNCRLLDGVVQHYRLPYNMLVITTEYFPDLRKACLSDSVQVESLTELLAVRRCYNSSKLMARSGVMMEGSHGVESEGFKFSTCQITATGSGGPLVDPDGNVIGLNWYNDREITTFVPTNQILECLVACGFRSSMRKKSTPSNFCSEGSYCRDSSSRGSENEKQEPGGVWCELDQELASKLSPSVISLASFDGETLHSECTGIVTDSKLSSPTFLTSRSLFRSVYGEHILTMTIKVRLPNDKVVDGSLQDYMGSYNLVLVTTDPLPALPDLRLACLSKSMQVESAAKVLAIRRCFKSGKLMTTTGVLIDSPSGVVSNELKLSTCKITEAASGGPLVDFDGNIVGMNYYDTETTSYVPTNFISECVGPAVFWSGSKDDGCSTSKRKISGIETSATPYNRWEEVTDHVEASPILEPTVTDYVEASPILEPTADLTDNDLKHTLDPWPSNVFTRKVNMMLSYSGYPLPSFADGSMYLKADFEEKFDKKGCSKSINRVASKMSRYVVALASFDDEDKRYFACTGMLIKCKDSRTRVLTSLSLVRTSGGENKIRKLRIEVCLPSKQCVPGTLQYYDPHYNMAVVSFFSGVSIRGVNVLVARRHRVTELSETPQTKVVALGRGFRSGEFMVTNGVVTGERSRFDCQELQMSTCKITKAGIGGPLIDFDGNFVGLNFYDVEETPYLPRNVILKLLTRLSAERTVATNVTKKSHLNMDVRKKSHLNTDVRKKSHLNRWPVPDPYWVYPSRHRQASHLSDGHLSDGYE
ncbi:uncharacterized protein LOC124678668 isoform X3 [Lolium rigidum]|uniref:uncharacterized protein LOC124678668 isoform X3 n=1 Tax=Lolium rigidum TaxID=89674 RepID=UPI001F5DD163|nr:uncharacterized protein LOC124678668 isoform X3 [Lolium rigidum]